MIINNIYKAGKMATNRLGVSLALSAMLALPNFAQAEKPLQPKDLAVIAGVKAKWGAPAPYLHAKKGEAAAQVMFVFDTLAWRDKDGKLIPATADSWEISDDLKTFRFKLNPKAKWHDGKPLTADDVAFTMTYLHQHPYVFADVEIVDENNIEVVNPHEIVFHTEKPFPAFMRNIATAMPILPKHIYQDVDNPVKFSDKTAMTGSGPYRIKAYDRMNKSYMFTAFEDYHRGQARVKEVRIQAIQPAGVVKTVQAGQVDMVTHVAPKQKAALEKAGFSLIRYSATHPVRLKFNFDNPLFKSLKVRQAFAKGIDRQALIDKAYQGESELWSAGGLHNLATDKADADIMQYNYDPNALKGVIPADTTLRLVTDKRLKKVAQVIVAQLKDLEINVDLTVTERGAANALFRKGEYDLGLATFSVLGDPLIFQQAEVGRRIDGDKYLSNKRFTQLLNDQVHETDAKKRAEMVRQASIIYSQEVPSVSLISKIRTYAYRPDVLTLYWNGYGIGRGIPTLLDREFFAAPFR